MSVKKTNFPRRNLQYVKIFAEHSLEKYSLFEFIFEKKIQATNPVLNFAVTA